MSVSFHHVLIDGLISTINGFVISESPEDQDQGRVRCQKHVFWYLITLSLERCRKPWFCFHANNKDADQNVHLRILVSAFVITVWKVEYERWFTSFETLLNPLLLSSITFQKHEIYTYLSINLCITYIWQFCADCKMGRAKINIIVEPSITYHLKKKKSYRNIQWETKGHEHEIFISTTHLVKHSICKNLGASTCSRKKPKIRPYRKPPQKSTSAVNLKVAVIMKKG